ncbi:MAG: GGDEF domain-containing protein [Ilumatobacteraceae bacterium]
MNDALDAMYVITQPEVPEIFAEYVADAESYLRSDGGYLGPDPASPLTASYVYRPSAAMPHPALAEIDEGIASSRLWDYDQWIRSWQIGTPDTAAPLSLADLVAQAGLVDGNTRGIVDATLEDARRSSRDAADSAGIRSTGWLVLGTTSALAAVTATVALVRRRRIATRRAARAVDTDELTGLGNRRLLEQRVGPTLRNPDLGWHLVAAIRMDHVALVNDTWGRSMGDRVLVEVARRLRAIVDDLQASDDVFSGTVVRLGSEFVMTLHSTAPMELETVAEMLEQIRITTIPVDADPDADPDGQAASGDDVALNFDLGIATASGPCDLDDMVRDAELSAWSERQAHRHDPALVTDTQR